MENLVNDLTCLISQLKVELQKKESSFPTYQLERAISVFSLMSDNIFSKSFDKNLSNDLETIMHWSIDSWPWDNLITKNAWRIIEEYNKTKNNMRK